MIGWEIAPAQETGSDRKVAKSVIPDTLGPRHPWRGTLSSSDHVLCALSYFIAARCAQVWVFTCLQKRLFYSHCQSFDGVITAGKGTPHSATGRLSPC